MRLIRNSGNNPLLRELSRAEAESVRRYCGAGLQTEPQDAAAVAGILAEMHDGKAPSYWLECDCRDAEGADQHPRMTARIRGEGSRHFVRIAGRDVHQCALRSFRTDPSDDEDDASDSAGKHRPLRPILDTLDYLDRQHQAGGARHGARTGRSSGANSGRRLPKLGRILYTLLEHAGFSSITNDGLDARNAALRHWDRLERFAIEEEVTDTLTLWDLMDTRPWVRASQMMTEVDKLTWPKGKKRMGYLLFVADEATSATATKFTSWKPAVVSPASPVRIGGRDQNFANPPYWVLAVVDRDDNGTARVREAFAQHAFDKDRPLPLDSNYERRTLALLLEVMEYVKKKGITVTLRKPLFDSEVTLADGEMGHCRADFELEVRAPGGSAATPGRLLIETMGADSQEYLDQKAATHAIMRRRGALIEHEVRNDGQQDARDDQFKRRAIGRVLGLAGIPR